MMPCAIPQLSGQGKELYPAGQQDLLRTGLARAAFGFYVFCVAFLAQQVLDSEQRFQRVLPEGRAYAQ